MYSFLTRQKCIGSWVKNTILAIVMKKKTIQILLPKNVWYLKGYNNKEKTYLANVLNKYTMEMNWLFINQSVHSNTHVKE